MRKFKIIDTNFRRKKITKEVHMDAEKRWNVEKENAIIMLKTSFHFYWKFCFKKNKWTIDPCSRKDQKRREECEGTCDTFLPRVLMAMLQLPNPIKSDLKEISKIRDACDIVSNLVKLTSYRSSKKFLNSWVSWISDRHWIQTLLCFERLGSIGDWYPILLVVTSKETSDSELRSNGDIQGREFMLGDIQDQMIEGKTSCDNPSYPHRDIYPMLFNLSIE